MAQHAILNMRNFKLTIEYDGTDFCGWQIQKKGERTVQSELKQTCEGIFKHDIVIIGSGRTDSGVHAKGQVAHFHADTRMKSFEIQKALNSCLPKDVAVLAVKEVPENFHAQYSVKEKTYRYVVLNATQRSVFGREYSYFYPYPLDLSKVRKAAKVLVGQHDFKAFQAYDPLRADKNTVRTIKKLNVKKEGDFIFIDIAANGFLYKMARNIAGTLLSVGSAQIPMEAVLKILKSKERSKASATAPSHGLCLLNVKYWRIL